MIYTVTFNPSLDYFFTLDDFKLGYTNRTTSEKIAAGGKGINVSYVLKSLGFDSTVLGFVAGFTGKQIEKMLEKDHIHTDFIHIEKGISRINCKFLSMDGTEINGMGPVIDDTSLNKLFDKLNTLTNNDTLFLSGSIPSSLSSDTYSRIMQNLQGKHVRIVVDATNDLLTNVLQYKPFLIKPNKHELEEIFSTKIKARTDCIPYMQELQGKGARNVLVSMASEGAMLLDEVGCVYDAKAVNGKLENGVGAGDSMVAGFMAGYMKTRDYQKAFHLGIASASATAFSMSLASANDIQAILQTVSSKRIK